MASINSIALIGTTCVSSHRHSQLPIHAHRNGWGALSRHPSHWAGIFGRGRRSGGSPAPTTCTPNGIGNKFSEPTRSVVASARAALIAAARGQTVHRRCRCSLRASQPHRPRRPGARSNDRPDLAASGGIPAHPGGPAAGVTELRAAWDAAMSAAGGHERTAGRTAGRFLRRRLHGIAGRDGGARLRGPPPSLPSNCRRRAPPLPRQRIIAASASPAWRALQDPAWTERYLPPVFDTLAESARRSRITRFARPSIPHRADRLDRQGDRSRGAATWWRLAPAFGRLPVFGRYQMFGHLFAAPQNGTGYRLDRHPTMSRHPATP